MRIVQSIAQLQTALQEARQAGETVGFVPTMGALHEGHMALITRAKKMTDLVVSSVFVNPTQFNNKSDLAVYPRTPEKDAALLEAHGCDIAFFPSVEEMYPENYEAPKIPLGNLATVMEGEFRPGHFDGVVQIVSRFFDIVKPDFAFFGMKDFQQVAVIGEMVRYLELPVTIVPCLTLRESTGLAMSSRNMRLSEEQKEEALHIYRTLERAKTEAASKTPRQVMDSAKAYFGESNMKLEYFSIVHPRTLEELDSEWVAGATACIAAFCGEVRLIDNMILLD